MAPETDAPAMRLYFPISFKVRHADARTVAWALRTYTTWREHSYLLGTSARAPARATACTQNACTSRWAARPHGHTHTQRVPAHEHKNGAARETKRAARPLWEHTYPKRPQHTNPAGSTTLGGAEKAQRRRVSPLYSCKTLPCHRPTARMYDDPRLHLSRQRPVDMTAQMPLYIW